MKLSVREARAQFAAAISAAERGERVTITRNGAPVAEIGPVAPTAEQPAVETFMERLARTRRELGFDKRDWGRAQMTDDEWLEWFNDPAWTREIFGPEYFDDEPNDVAA